MLDNQKIQVLILEDNPSDVYLLEKRLSQNELNYESRSCDNKKAFESLLEECKPDLILADIQLSAYDGFQALEYAKKTCPNTAFIFITGSYHPEKALDLVRKGALDVVFKESLDRLDDAIYRAFRVAQDRKELKKAKALNRMLSRVSKVGAWEYIVATGETNWSPEVSHIYERDTEQAPDVEEGMSYYSEGKDRSIIARSFKNAIEKGIPYDHEVLLVTEKGNEKCIRTVGIPEVLNGKCIRVYGTIQDVSEIRENEVKTKHLAERHQLVLDATEAAVWDWNVPLDKAIIDQSAEKIFGHRVEEIGQLNEDDEYVFSFEAFREWIHPDDRKRVDAKLEEHLLGRSDEYAQQFRATTKDGTIIWVYAKGRVLKRGSHGEAIRMVGSMVDITDMREASENFETLFMYSPIPKIVFDKKSLEIELANKSAADLYGYTVGELNSMPVSMLKGLDNVVENREQIERDIKKGLPEGAFITEHTRKDGEVLTVEVHHAQLTYRGTEAIVLAVKDVTEKIRSEKKIEQLSLVASKTTNGIVITDKDENIVWMNAGFEKLTGYSESELLGKNPNVLQGEETSPAARKKLEKAIEQAKPTKVEILNYHKKGTPYWVEIYLDPVKDENGNVTNFIAIENDITKRKTREKELKQSKEFAEKTLYELQQQKYALDEHAIVSITDQKGAIEYVNDKFCELSKYSRAELLGQDHRIINSGYHTKNFFQHLYRTIAAGEVWHGEIKNKAKDGSFYWVDTTIAPFIDKQSGKPVNYVSIRTDITQRKKAEEDLRMTLDNLEEIVKERTHELEVTQSELKETYNDLLDSMRYAKRIQQAIIPSIEELKHIFNDAHTIYLPKDIVSGDFFWQEKINGKTVVALADCTGHGVPGAMMSMLGNELLDKTVITNGVESPRLILEEVDHDMKKLLKRESAKFNMDDGMDISICSVDYDTNTFVYAGAQSHGLYYHHQTGELEKLKPTRRGIGGGRIGLKKEFEEVEFPFKNNDRFYLFSDGYYDQWGGPKGKKILRKRFSKRIEQTVDLPLAEQMKILKSEFQDWKGTEMQADDVSVLGIKL